MLSFKTSLGFYHQTWFPSDWSCPKSKYRAFSYFQDTLSDHACHYGHGYLGWVELLVLLSFRSLSGIFSHHGRLSSESRFSSKVQIIYSLSCVMSKFHVVFLNRDSPSMSEATKSNSNCLNCLGSLLSLLGNTSNDDFFYFVLGSVSQSMALSHCHTRWYIFI